MGLQPAKQDGPPKVDANSGPPYTISPVVKVFW
jgi:hypothetical protein